MTSNQQYTCPSISMSLSSIWLAPCQTSGALLGAMMLQLIIISFMVI